jgi:hypothetical protein
VTDELVGREPNVLGDQANEGGGDLSSAMHRDRGGSAVRVAKLLVRPALPDLAEAEGFQDRDDGPRLERRDAPDGA